MTRILSSNVASLYARHRLNRTWGEMQQAMQRLSTGLRINRASDNPAGLIAAGLLDNQADAIEPAIEQVQRGANLIASADGALAQVADLLISIQQLVIEAANTAATNRDQVGANQLQVDAAIESIRRLVQTTTFAGRRLLDGSLDYTTSGLASADISSLRIGHAGLANGTALGVTVQVTVSAQPAVLQFRSSQLTGPAYFRLAGPDGQETLHLASGATVSAIRLAVNQAAAATGVSASWINPGHPSSGLAFTTLRLGSRAFLSVETLDGGLALTDALGGPASRDAGRDAVATINDAPAAADGDELALHATDLGLTLRLADGFATGSTAFAVTGGGAPFIIGPSAGSDVVSLGFPSADPSALGTPATGYLSEIATGGGRSLIGGGATKAAAVVEAAISQVSMLRGRLGSFAGQTLDQGALTLRQMLETSRAGESVIRDADFATETAALARAQVLAEVATGVMSMANSTRDLVLRLLG